MESGTHVPLSIFMYASFYRILSITWCNKILPTPLPPSQNREGEISFSVFSPEDGRKNRLILGAREFLVRLRTKNSLKLSHPRPILGRGPGGGVISIPDLLRRSILLLLKRSTGEVEVEMGAIFGGENGHAAGGLHHLHRPKLVRGRIENARKPRPVARNPHHHDQPGGRVIRLRSRRRRSRTHRSRCLASG